jgi:hypothetical protein
MVPVGGPQRIYSVNALRFVNKQKENRLHIAQDSIGLIWQRIRHPSRAEAQIVGSSGAVKVCTCRLESN